MNFFKRDRLKIGLIEMKMFIQKRYIACTYPGNECNECPFKELIQGGAFTCTLLFNKLEKEISSIKETNPEFFI